MDEAFACDQFFSSFCYCFSVIFSVIVAISRNRNSLIHCTGQTLLLNLAFTKPELITEVISLSLLNSNGAAMESFTVERGQGIHSGSYYVLFTPFSERFRFQLTGKTIDGKILRRVKPTEIQIREVQFDYGSVNYSERLFPGITAKIPLKIRNVGISQNLTLKGMDDLGFIKSLEPNYLFVAENDTAQFSLVMRAPANASSGETSTVTLYATVTSSGKLSNYMVFYVSVTTKVSMGPLGVKRRDIHSRQHRSYQYIMEINLYL